MKPLLALALAFLVGFTSPAIAQPDSHVTHQGMTCFFGVLHAHTVLSPDFSPRPSNAAQFVSLVGSNSPARFDIQSGPTAAWERAALSAKLDFLALTDHAHGPENNQPEFCSHEMPRGGHRLIVEAAERINSDPQFRGKFLAIPGVEWSTIDSGNHVNIFFARNPIPSDIENGDFRSLVNGYLANQNFEGNNPLLLVQMNHPNQTSSGIGYGRGDFNPGDAGDREFVDFYGPHYVGIEHINNSDGGNSNALELNAHRNGDSLEGFYREYLNMGFRIAPVGDHDNHRANWGRHTAARTGVWARELTPEGFIEAYKARRVFATEDNELSVVFMIGNNWMGSEVQAPSSGGMRTFTVRIDQMEDTQTGSVQDEGPYVVELIGDRDGAGGALPGVARIRFNGQERQSIRVQQGVTVQFTRWVEPGEYYYLHVRETSGMDSGNQPADAWTAPIFFAD